ncbi:hypothetical protein L1987_17260 [Smallanthus sonchifolius]|uniref:Uncharacterized protein n=1 Tax=Smallanthus sonchifolius TaxID=185202 RepID=A0ACB9IX00_9ASTR|nr:hypothetical protein L1987_17260 [Smallanthus sonchifolius]
MGTFLQKLQWPFLLLDRISDAAASRDFIVVFVYANLIDAICFYFKMEVQLNHTLGRCGDGKCDDCISQESFGRKWSSIKNSVENEKINVGYCMPRLRRGFKAVVARRYGLPKKKPSLFHLHQAVMKKVIGSCGFYSWTDGGNTHLFSFM